MSPRRELLTRLGSPQEEPWGWWGGIKPPLSSWTEQQVLVSQIPYGWMEFGDFFGGLRGRIFIPYVGHVSAVEEDPIYLPLPSKWLSQINHLCFGSLG